MVTFETIHIVKAVLKCRHIEGGPTLGDICKYIASCSVNRIEKKLKPDEKAQIRRLLKSGKTQGIFKSGTTHKRYKIGKLPSYYVNKIASDKKRKKKRNKRSTNNLQNKKSNEKCKNKMKFMNGSELLNRKYHHGDEIEYHSDPTHIRKATIIKVDNKRNTIVLRNLENWKYCSFQLKDINIKLNIKENKNKNNKKNNNKKKTITRLVDTDHVYYDHRLSPNAYNKTIPITDNKYIKNNINIKESPLRKRNLINTNHITQQTQYNGSNNNNINKMNGYISSFKPINHYHHGDEIEYHSDPQNPKTQIRKATIIKVDNKRNTIVLKKKYNWKYCSYKLKDINIKFNIKENNNKYKYETVSITQKNDKKSNCQNLAEPSITSDDKIKCEELMEWNKYVLNEKSKLSEMLEEYQKKFDDLKQESVYKNDENIHNMMNELLTKERHVKKNISIPHFKSMNNININNKINNKIFPKPINYKYNYYITARQNKENQTKPINNLETLSDFSNLVKEQMNKFNNKYISKKVNIEPIENANNKLENTKYLVKEQMNKCSNKHNIKPIEQTYNKSNNNKQKIHKDLNVNKNNKLLICNANSINKENNKLFKRLLSQNMNKEITKPEPILNPTITRKCSSNIRQHTNNIIMAIV